MPDGDKFERRLLGKAWKQAYRFVCRNEDFDESVRLVRNATEQVIRDGLGCPKLDQIADLLHKMLGVPLFASIDSIHREYEFAQHLDDIAASQFSYPGTRLAVEAARSVYAEMDSRQQTVTISQVRERLLKKFKERVIDNQFFSRAREGIQEKIGWNNQEQIDFEKRLIESALSSKYTPRRIQSQPTWDLDHLNQPIPVMEA